MAVWNYTREALRAGALFDGELPPGVKPIAAWREAPYGSVLFFAEPASKLFPFQLPALHRQDGRCGDLGRRWKYVGGGGVGLHEPFEQLVAHGPPGLHLLGTGSNAMIRMTMAYATPEVAAIRLTNDRASWMSDVGVDGFCLLGSVADGGVTHATAVGHDGSEIPGTSITV